MRPYRENRYLQILRNNVRINQYLGLFALCKIYFWSRIYLKLCFLCNFSQLPLSNISLFTVLFTADDVFCLFSQWLGIFVEVDIDIITSKRLCYQPIQKFKNFPRF